MHQLLHIFHVYVPSQHSCDRITFAFMRNLSKEAREEVNRVARRKGMWPGQNEEFPNKILYKLIIPARNSLHAASYMHITVCLSSEHNYIQHRSETSRAMHRSMYGELNSNRRSLQLSDNVLIIYCFSLPISAFIFIPPRCCRRHNNNRDSTL